MDYDYYGDAFFYFHANNSGYKVVVAIQGDTLDAAMMITGGTQSYTNAYRSVGQLRLTDYYVNIVCKKLDNPSIAC